MTPKANEPGPVHGRSVVVTIREAAKQYKVTQKRIRAALDSGELSCYDGAGVKPTRMYRTDVEAWLNRKPT